MQLQCPHCSTRYQLPERLIGPGGAEVRCPRCRRNFDVGPDGRVLGSDAVPVTREDAPRKTETRESVTQAEASAPPSAATPRGEVAAAAPEARAAAPATTEPEGRAAIARAVLDELVVRSGDAIGAAHARGRLFAEFGPALLAAFDEYRRRAGGQAESGPFRDALRERWNIELAPRWGEERTSA